MQQGRWIVLYQTPATDANRERFAAEMEYGVAV
jgi:hypothetical protein